ncbi:Carbonic anhydrase or acetyltransferase, isoleucine patch superfamily [Streptoalloteichus tenebrarius]|uniref:Carbonic anhydrase or acetyltransferase, isoleucine patch superfamily n=1 Tax=Streptoalloteichus tenebrarius (strain ATCC 17920 / DSM 40477 / JCM 4838 / CBS 697.72 / NBRC 16177 / NCIMB 11028 / NRRL B-12390 / A12253. 1 / ISP 5477) TaxID=1933 RepID=A0ABT1HZH7_STRSD|nr:gamma carbonic anhydrase family protein [Streptoalloteichus tenebrarius]MCP2260929.1 Carbonic anhydrase or acetyltransferase, isoleucine patch superfamily [Streptoalloteichus tenebrarius]BFF03309.1 gamma carbonic anhydrase family protein [Streptoalloteichus tenebrarius]
MPIYALGDVEPRIHPDAYVHPDATVIGDVRIRAHASVWPRAVLRGDYGRIEVGERTSVQDGTVVHCTEFHPTVIGADCVIGHNVHIEGATIADRCLIASGSVVLNGAVVETGAVVGAGAVVSFDGHVPARAMALGVPARIREGYEVPDGAFQFAVDKYVANIDLYWQKLRRLD